MFEHHPLHIIELSFVQKNAVLLFLLPLVTFFLIVFYGKLLRFKGAEIGLTSTFIVWLMAIKIAIEHYQNDGEGVIQTFNSSSNVLGTYFNFGTLLDGLSIVMIVTVSSISLLVHLFSLSYMKGDKRYTHYYSILSLFTASMLLCVTAPTSLQLLIGWELVGLCSFLLIGHWWEKDENVFAALKAFFMTRTADIGLLFGTILTFFIVQDVVGRGSFSISLINESAAVSTNGTLMLITALVFLVAIIGKSGQFPLHTWLPDAMAGPTPVSALIHAATMVVAGVFLCARMYPIFLSAFNIEQVNINILAIVGAVTIIVGAFNAFRQSNLKKVLAYSTVSQLGYMIMGLGVGAWSASIFHLFTHAFFKALLFLCAGAISTYATHHSFDMKKDMGGLRKLMPVTFYSFMAGTLALLGLFPFAGFWSKDEILAGAGANGYLFFQIIGIVGALMTAAYMTRTVYYVFFGEYRGTHEPKEADFIMKAVMIVLAIAALGVGFVNATAFNIHKFTEFLGNSTSSYIHQGPHEEFDLTLALFITGLTLLSVVAWLTWKKTRSTTESKLISIPSLDVFYNKVVESTKNLAFFIYNVIETNGIDGVTKSLEYSAKKSGVIVEKQQKIKIRLGLMLIIIAISLLIIFSGGK
jgi:NADH-quinone oxidoreductase subunit L